ncbi:hypothetical protein Q1695_006057 [Nippostrongylus brasiliensis]|nr:hypothetical protein Q1695_006057 [Nippostrongylus brasiliensis]
MSSWCQLCEVQCENILELDVHYISLSHHIKLEERAPKKTTHHCHPCVFTCNSLGEYSKHVDSKDHRKVRDRMRAIIDSADAGEQPLAAVVNHGQEANRVTLASNYLEPSGNFVRNGVHRMRFPGDQGMSELERHRYQGSPAFDAARPPPAGAANAPPFPVKRGILARLSLRGKKDKGSTPSTGSETKSDQPDKKSGRSDKKEKKGKKKRSVSASPSTSSKPDQQTKGGNSGASQIKRAALLSVSMKDKTKKWELVAVKGKASYLKNRSQRMLKDRMAKYRLVDSKGAVIEETVENEPGPSSSDLCRRPSSKSTSGVPHLTSHIWGTGPEAIPRSQQKGSSGKPLNVSFAPSIIAPSVPPTPNNDRQQANCELADWNDTNSGYASMRSDFPMSTPKSYNSAVRAYENYQGFPESGALSTEKCNNAQRDTRAGGTTNNDNLNFSTWSLANSSLALDSHSLASRMEVTALPNVTRCSETSSVKEEPHESPPPEALPSPPQFNETVVNQQNDSVKMGGEKEREEFWALGIAEMKKGREILEARAKIEELQKQLFDATTALQTMEVEMNEILRRKSELLGLSQPSTFV